MNLRIKTGYFYPNIKLYAVLTLAVSIASTVTDAKITEPKLHRQTRIIGGQEVTAGEWPWLVSLRGKITTRSFLSFIPLETIKLVCGGAVLNDHWILTAAHCFDYRSYQSQASDPSNWQVRLASEDLQPDIGDRILDFFGRVLDRQELRTWEIDVDRIVRHPNYRRGNYWENDIALIKLSSPVPSGSDFSRIQRINLPVANDNTFPQLGQECTMKGWGCTRAGTSVIRSARSAQLPIYDANRCASQYGFTSLGDRICAGFENRQTGICPGDSGGPLTCQRSNGEWVQVGIATFTSRNHPADFPGVFTKVSAYVDWINSVIGG